MASAAASTYGTRSARNRPVTSPACVLISSPTITLAPPRSPAAATAADTTLWSVMHTTSIFSSATRSASWSSVVTASPEATVCRWQSTRTQPARISDTAYPRASGLQGLERAPGAVLDSRAENVRIGRAGSHRVGRVPDEDALQDAGQLPVCERHVEADVGQVAPGTCRVPVGDLDPARKAGQGGGRGLGHRRHRRRRPFPARVLRPVREQRADVGERIAERAQLP